jgi:hypothetical protein
MESRFQSEDEQNGSFGPADRPLQNLKPGFESGEQKREVAQGDRLRRLRSEEKAVPRAPLAKRIREREAR